MPIQIGSKLKYNCNLQVKYTVDGHEYNGHLITNDNVPYLTNNSINITYDNTNPTNIAIKQIDSKTGGLILSGIGAVVLIALWVNYYYAQTSTGYAATQGLNSIINMGRQNIRI